MLKTFKLCTGISDIAVITVKCPSTFIERIHPVIIYAKEANTVNMTTSAETPTPAIALRERRYADAEALFFGFAEVEASAFSTIDDGVLPSEMKEDRN